MSDYTSSYQPGGASSSTLSAFFDNRTEAENAIIQLRSIGVPNESIQLTGEESGSAASEPRESKGFFEALGDFFMPDEDRYAYAEGLSRGGYLVTVVDVPSELQESALDVLDTTGTINIDERSESWRAEVWTGYPGGQGVGRGVSAGFGERRRKRLRLLASQIRVRFTGALQTDVRAF